MLGSNSMIAGSRPRLPLGGGVLPFFDLTDTATGTNRLPGRRRSFRVQTQRPAKNGEDDSNREISRARPTSPPTVAMLWIEEPEFRARDQPLQSRERPPQLFLDWRQKPRGLTNPR